jgi:predicted RNA-binding Zn-ribbon protein involved in translation (DUF1610 family)
MEMSSSDVVAAAKANPVELWVKAKQLAGSIVRVDQNGVRHGERGRNHAMYSLKSWLEYNGILNLPEPKLGLPGNVKEETGLTWQQAEAVCNSASKPFNLILRLMLLNGWGLTQFLQFNSDESWAAIRAFIQANPTQEYFRVGFLGRKSNRKKFYSLIPLTVLRDILNSGVQLPFRTVKKSGKMGAPLNVQHYVTAKAALEGAWRTALVRAPIPPFNGTKPSLHELRDTFKTYCTHLDVNDSVSEFFLGHRLDAQNYNKCYRDESWLWNRIKVIYGPSVATTTELEARDRKIEELESMVKGLTNLVTQKLGMYLVTCDRCGYQLGPEDDLDHFKCPQCGSNKYTREHINQLYISKNLQPEPSVEAPKPKLKLPSGKVVRRKAKQLKKVGRVKVKKRRK